MLTTKSVLVNVSIKGSLKSKLTNTLRFHSSSTSDPTLVLSSEANEQNSNSTQAVTSRPRMGFKQHLTLNPQHSNSSSNTVTKSPTKPSFRLKKNRPFDHLSLPSVPTTRYIDKNSLNKDMLFTGFRPVLSPIQHSIVKSKKRKETIPLTWNYSACKLKSFDDYSFIPQFIVDKLVPFNPPNPPGNEIIIDNHKLAKLREDNERKLHTEEVYEFLKHFRK